jgi:hypothetical protein
VESDIVARAIAIAALVVAAIDVGVTVKLWQQSGPQLKVRLRRETYPTDRLVIEVLSVGRMAIRVKDMGLEDRVTTSTNAAAISYITLPVAPADGKPVERVLEYTDSPIVAEVPMAQIVARWFPGRSLTLVAWAKDGNDRKTNSPPLRFRTPPTAAPVTKGLRIIQARYGAQDTYMDMKAILEGRIQNDRLRVIVSNDLAGKDPLYNVPKALEVEYSFDGQPFTTVVLEGSELVLP